MTIAGQSYPVPQPFLVLATQNPIESEGTYPLPEAQTDRFLMKLVVDYPSPGEEAAVVGRSLEPRPDVERRAEASDLLAFRDEVRGLRGPRGDRLRGRAGRRHPQPRGLGDRRARPATSSTAPARAGRSAWSRRHVRWRCCAAGRHAMLSDIRDLAPDVLRHRLVLSYEALSDGVTADQMLDRVVAAVDAGADAPVGSRASPRRRRRSWPRDERRRRSRPPAGRKGPGPIAGPPRRGARPVVRAAGRRAPARRAPRPRSGRRHRAGDICADTSRATTCGASTPRPPLAPASRTCASTCRSAWSAPGWCWTCRRRWRSARPSA